MLTHVSRPGACGLTYVRKVVLEAVDAPSAATEDSVGTWTSAAVATSLASDVLCEKRPLDSPAQRKRVTHCGVCLMSARAPRNEKGKRAYQCRTRWRCHG